MSVCSSVPRRTAPKPSSPNEPTFFDELFDKALEEKEGEIAKTREEIQREARARRSCKPQKPKRPAEYLYSGLEECWHTEMPKGINPDDYDVIGKDVTRTLHRDSAKFWVECTERPILRRKADKNAAHPKIVQASAPVPVIGGNHVGADVLARSSQTSTSTICRNTAKSRCSRKWVSYFLCQPSTIGFMQWPINFILCTRA